MTTLRLDLGNETAVFMDVQPETDGAGRLREVANSKLEANFNKVSRSLAKIAESLEVQFKAMAKRPDNFEIEMGAELKGEADLWIVAGEATGHFKVKMTWNAATST